MQQVGLQQPLDLLGDGPTGLARQQIHLQQGVIEGEPPWSLLSGQLKQLLLQGGQNGTIGVDLHGLQQQGLIGLLNHPGNQEQVD